MTNRLKCRLCVRLGGKKVLSNLLYLRSENVFFRAHGVPKATYVDDGHGSREYAAGPASAVACRGDCTLVDSTRLVYM